MGIYKKRWCPCGCGKQVQYYGKKEGFECEICKEHWKTVADMEERWKD